MSIEQNPGSQLRDMLNLARDVYGVTFRQIAEFSGTHEAQISNYARGKDVRYTNPTAKTFERISTGTRRAVNEQVNEYRKLSLQYLREQSRYPFFGHHGAVSEEGSPAPSEQV